MLIVWKSQIASTYENVGMEETTIDNSNQAAIFSVENCFHLDFYSQIHYNVEGSKYVNRLEKSNCINLWKCQNYAKENLHA